MAFVCNAYLLFKIKKKYFYPMVLKCCSSATNYTNIPFPASVIPAHSPSEELRAGREVGEQV